MKNKKPHTLGFGSGNASSSDSSIGFWSISSFTVFLPLRLRRRFDDFFLVNRLFGKLPSVSVGTIVNVREFSVILKP